MSSPSDPPTSLVDPDAPLKVRLVQAALDAIVELTPAGLLDAVGAREIGRRAGGSAASIYHHYGSLAGLADAAVQRVFDPALAHGGLVIDLLEEIEDSHLPLEAAYAFHGAELDRMTRDHQYRIRMGLWAFGGDSATEAYRHYLRTIDDAIGAYVERVFAAWGRELRPPFDTAAFVAAKVALVNGSALRQLVEPEDWRRATFQRANVALDLLLLRVPGDRHDTDDRLTELNYYPLARTARPRDSARTTANRARILRAAAELFSTRGYSATSLELVASHADCALSTVKRSYPTKQTLAVALFGQYATDLIAAPTAEPSGGSGRNDPLEPLRTHLVALARLAAPRTEMASAYLAHLVTTTDDLTGDALLSATREVLPGPLDERFPDHQELVEALVTLTLRNVVSHPARGATEHAHAALRLLGLADPLGPGR